MSVNSTVSSVNSSSATSQVSKSSSTESSKKTSDSSFKNEMDKVSTTEKKENDTKVESKDVKETKETSKTQKSEETTKAENTKDTKVDDKSAVNDKKETNPAVDNKENLLKDIEKNNIELIKNQQILDKKNFLGTDNKLQQEQQAQQVQFAQANLNKNKIENSLTKKSDVKADKKRENELDSISTELDNDLQVPTDTSQLQATDNNFNTDSLVADENSMLNGNVIFNNALSSFDINNNELSNDIQQMINTSTLAHNVAGVKATNAVGTMKLNNSTNSISMTQSDAEFFVNLTQNNDVSMQNITAQATEMTQQGADVKEVQQNVKVSQALLDALTESREKNQPVRIDFDQNVSVVLRVGKDGALAANFIPGDKAVEQYLKNNIETLKNTFNENDLPYSDLSYSNRGGKQQRENQRNRQQQQQ